MKNVDEVMQGIPRRLVCRKCANKKVLCYRCFVENKNSPYIEYADNNVKKLYSNKTIITKGH